MNVATDYGCVQKIALAAGLGLLVGFQREWTAPHVAGLRTFAFITVFGCMAGLLIGQTGVWLPSAGLLVVAAMIIVGNVVKFGDVEFGDAEKEPGLTTQAAALLMYLVGVAIALDQLELSIMVGGGTAVLLHWKKPLHSFVQRIGEADIRGIIQLVLVALVILPLLPNEDYGPYGVLNPFEIWLMVVLIVGISLTGFIGYKFLGARAGAPAGRDPGRTHFQHCDDRQLCSAEPTPSRDFRLGDFGYHDRLHDRVCQDVARSGPGGARDLPGDCSAVGSHDGRDGAGLGRVFFLGREVGHRTSNSPRNQGNSGPPLCSACCMQACCSPSRP